MEFLGKESLLREHELHVGRVAFLPSSFLAPMLT